MISLLCSQLKPEEVRDCLSTTKIYNQSANYLTAMHGNTVQTQLLPRLYGYTITIIEEYKQ